MCIYAAVFLLHVDHVSLDTYVACPSKSVACFGKYERGREKVECVTGRTEWTCKELTETRDLPNASVRPNHKLGVKRVGVV